MRVLLAWVLESTCNTLPAQSLIIPNHVISPPPPRRTFHMSRTTGTAACTTCTACTACTALYPVKLDPFRFLKSDAGKGARDYTSLAHLTEDYQRAVGEGFLTSSTSETSQEGRERDETNRANMQLQEMRASARMDGAGEGVDVLNPLG